MSSACWEMHCLRAMSVIDILPALQNSWHISVLTQRNSPSSAPFVTKPLADRLSLQAIRRCTITSRVIPAQTAANSLKPSLCLSTTSAYTLEKGRTFAYIKSVVRDLSCPKLSRSTWKHTKRRRQKVS